MATLKKLYEFLTVWAALNISAILLKYPIFELCFEVGFIHVFTVEWVYFMGKTTAKLEFLQIASSH